MSHYDEAYDELHKDEIKLEEDAKFAKRKLMKSLPINTMIKIMFESYLNSLSNKQIVELSKLHNNRSETYL